MHLTHPDQAAGVVLGVACSRGQVLLLLPPQVLELESPMLCSALLGAGSQLSTLVPMSFYDHSFD